mmetsp:Transcript_7857/g.19245  ORF Transcript_7857/g.19245 Transcript_7857/m.19245 type:complete len:108 (+) Transcript_7857:1441-1764(+)
MLDPLPKIDPRSKTDPRYATDECLVLSGRGFNRAPPFPCMMEARGTLNFPLRFISIVDPLEFSIPLVEERGDGRGEGNGDGRGEGDGEGEERRLILPLLFTKTSNPA